MSKQTEDGKSKSRRTLVIIVVVFIILIVAIPATYIIYTLNRTNYDNSQDDEIIVNEEIITEEVATGYQNFVIFGVDSRENALLSDTRSDTIMLVSINRETKEVKLASIYRDTYVEVPSHGYTKLNHAYAYGGYALALSTINTNFDLDLTQYVTVNFYAVTKVIDLLGGITLDITDDELKWLNGYMKENNKVNGTNVPGLESAGTQEVNGTQALAYARIRYTSGGDFKRAERQRIVVSKIFEKAKQADLTTIISIINEMLPEISTNISTSEILTLGKDILNYQIADSIGFPYEKETSKINGVSYVIPLNLADNVTQLHQYLYEETEYTPSTAVTTRSEYIQSLGY